MKILLRKTLSDGRKVLVYNDGTEQYNIVAVISNGTYPSKILRMKEEEERWKDELPKELGVSKEELGLN